MITVNVIKENNQIKTIKVSGHAKYASYGKDIVCAAASSIVITTINGILSINKDAINVIEGNTVEITLLNDDVIVTKLINNMLNLLEDLEKQYPKNIKIK